MAQLAVQVSSGIAGLGTAQSAPVFWIGLIDLGNGNLWLKYNGSEGDSPLFHCHIAQFD